MSDSFEMLVDVDAMVENADTISQSVLDRFRELGLITEIPNEDCVLGGMGYRPGPAIADYHESWFWNQATCGVQSRIGRSFNEWALGPVIEGFTCPSCGAKVDGLGGEFGEAVSSAISEWIDETGAAPLYCPQCSKVHAITDWHCKPALGFGNVSFTFWNWPRLDSPSWKIDLAALVQDVTGHTVVRTYGRL